MSDLRVDEGGILRLGDATAYRVCGVRGDLWLTAWCPVDDWR